MVSLAKPVLLEELLKLLYQYYCEKLFVHIPKQTEHKDLFYQVCQPPREDRQR